MRRFVRMLIDGRPRVGRLEGETVMLFEHDDPLRALHEEEEPTTAVEYLAGALLPPIEAPEIWCAGVTYERSREARLAESTTDARDAYARVYDADRPELFLKMPGCDAPWAQGARYGCAPIRAGWCRNRSLESCSAGRVSRWL
jgi:hypothetical protein